MAAPAERAVAVECVFDRAGEALVAQAYRVLVPERWGRSLPQPGASTARSCISWLSASTSISSAGP